MTSSTIKRFEIFNEIHSSVAVSTEDGDRIFNKIKESFKNGSSVILDFKGIKIIVSTFLNASVGQLYSTFKEDEIREKLKVENLADDDLSILKKVVDNAKEYFADKAGFEKPLKDLLGDE